MRLGRAHSRSSCYRKSNHRDQRDTMKEIPAHKEKVPPPGDNPNNDEVKSNARCSVNSSPKTPVTH